MTCYQIVIMATIHKRKHSQYLYCSFRVPVVDPVTGEKQSKQILRCTKKTDRKEAEKAARAIEEAVLAEYGADEGKSRKTLEILREATEHAARGTLTESLARRLLEEIYEAANGEKLEWFSTRSWFAEWLERKKRSVKGSTFSLYRLSCDTFVEWLGEKADMRIEQVKPQEVRRWRDELHDEGRAAKTCNQYFKSVSSAFMAAVKDGVLLKSPCDGIDLLPLDDSTTRQPFTVEEIAKLREVASPDWSLAIAIGFYTGLRLRDIANLKWSDVDLQKRVMIVEPLKQARKKAAKKKLLIPIHDLLLDGFAEHPVTTGEPDSPVFPSLAKKQSGGNGGLSFQFSDIMDSANVDPVILREPEEGMKGRKVTAKGFHSLRHSFVSELANNEVSPELRQEIAGHSDSASHQIYTHLDQERLRGVIDKLPRI